MPIGMVQKRTDSKNRSLVDSGMPIKRTQPAAEPDTATER